MPITTSRGDLYAPIPLDKSVSIERKTPPAGTGGTNIANTGIYTRNAEYQERFREKRTEKYRNALYNLPQRGGGLHGALMSVCNLGVIAGIPDHVLLNEIAATGRKFRTHEIEDAIKKAMQNSGQLSTITSTNSGREYSAIFNDKEKKTAIQEKLIQKGGNQIDPSDADVWEASNPHPGSFPRSGGLDGSECCADMILFLEQLYKPEDRLYVGTGFEKTYQQSEHIKTASQWIEFFTAELNAIQMEPNERKQFYKIQSLADRFPLIIPNPLSGEPLESGSYRSDANVTAFRYIVVECDDTPLEKQIPMIAGLGLPVVSMTFSGSRSIHALLNAAALNGGSPIRSLEEWKHVVKDNLFGQIDKLGFDKATSNPARLSRLPGIWRPDKDKFQKLLYVNRKRGALCLMK